MVNTNFYTLKQLKDFISELDLPDDTPIVHLDRSDEMASYFSGISVMTLHMKEGPMRCMHYPNKEGKECLVIG